MAFSSMIFLWVFLPVVLLVYWVLPSERVKSWWLLGASLLFYCWSDTKAFPLFCLFVLINWIFGKYVCGRKTVLFLGVALDLALLCYYKYVPGAGTMPLGLSFYTFLGISYLVDRYKDGSNGKASLVASSLYFSFFPRVSSGPIIRYGDFERDLLAPEISSEKTAYGIRRFIIGFAKKAVISDQIAPSVNGLFLLDMETAPSLYLFVGLALYTIQIYYDFSGYSDMAIGLAAMFGYSVPENFDYPYSRQSITDFWRTWHMTLSHWFRDYIYIPLGGNRHGLIRTCLNLGVVYLATGIWHGAGLCYIAWGLWNGFFVIAERIGLKKLLDRIPQWMRHCYTLTVTMIGWVFFRAGSLTRALSMLRAIFSFQHGDALPIRMFVGPGTWVLFLIGVLFAFPVVLWARSLKIGRSDKFRDIMEPVLLIALLLVSILFVASGSYSSFIYFQF